MCTGGTCEIKVPYYYLKDGLWKFDLCNYDIIIINIITIHRNQPNFFPFIIYDLHKQVTKRAIGLLYEFWEMLRIIYFMGYNCTTLEFYFFS